MANTHNLPELRCNWLIEPNDQYSFLSVPATNDLQQVDLNLSPEIGHGWLERLPLGDGIALMHSVHHFLPTAAGQLVPLGEFKMEFPQAILGIQTVQGGTVCHREFHPPAELIYRPGYDFFRHADCFHTMPLIDASSDSEMTSLILSAQAISELLGFSLAEQLIRGLGLNDTPAVKVLAIPLKVSAPLRTAMVNSLAGPLRKLYAQAKVLEYLCALSAHVCPQTSLTAPVPPKKRRIHQVHSYLLQLEGKLPTLEELAKKFGRSPRALNDDFMAEYGQSIYTFITEHRLHEARIAMLSSEVPLKTLAERLGYSHVNHFNAAFKRKFGIAPGSFRKSGSV